MYRNVEVITIGNFILTNGEIGQSSLEFFYSREEKKQLF